MPTESLRAELAARIPAAPPRPVELLPGLRLSAGGLGPLAPLAFVFVMAGCMPAIMFLTEPGMRLAQGTRTTGRVERVEPDRMSPEYVSVRYSFASPDGLQFRGEDSVSTRSAYGDVHEGDAVPVLYLPTDPTTNGMAGGRRVSSAPPWFIFLIFPVAVLAFCVPLLWPRYSQLIRDRRLFRIGTLAAGRVLFVGGQAEWSWPGWPRPTRSTVFVATRLDTGDEREVRAVCTNDWLLVHLGPGTEVTVVYDPASSRAVLLENYLR